MRTLFSLIASLLALCALAALYLWLGLPEDDAVASVILWQLRLPRLLCAVGVGALLSVAGAIMQSLFRNPLVEPYTMGLSGGAVVGVAVVIVGGLAAAWGGAALALGAAVGAALSMMVVLALRRLLGFDASAMLMAGIMISFVASAATTLMLSVGSQQDVAQIFAWSIGSLDGASPQLGRVAALVALVAVPLSALCGNVLNVLSLGDAEALALGVDARRAVVTLFVVSALLTALSVAAAGIVAFVGMVVPHLARAVVGHDNRLALPASGVWGAAMLLACDLVAKSVVAPRELPVGAVTSALGGCAFLYILVRWRKTRIG